ncbi:MAG: hypothetical protein AAF734_11890, partial [Bacteroidota bacterium]
DPLHKRLYYACIYLLILSKDQVGLKIVIQVINTETKRFNKRTEIYRIYHMLKVMEKNEADTLNLISTLEENYPKEWLKKYDDANSDNIYNLKEYENWM